MDYSSQMNGIPERSTVFPVGPPVAPEHQIGRESDIDRVAEALRGLDHVVLSDERRAGKSTVALGAIEHLVDRDGSIVVAVNLHEGITSSNELASEILRQAAIQKSKPALAGHQAKEFVFNLWNRVKGLALPDEIDDPEIAFGRSILAAFESKESGSDRVAAALEIVDELARSRKVKAAVFIDEAQEIDSWPDGDELQRALKTLLRRSPRTTAFLFAGSHKSLMETLFAEDGLLKYDGLHLALSPLHQDLTRNDLRRSFRDRNRDIATRAVEVALAESDMRPLRLMLISNTADRLASESGLDLIDEDLMKLAVREARKDRLWNEAP